MFNLNIQQFRMLATQSISFEIPSNYLSVNNFQMILEVILQQLEGKTCWKSFLKTHCRKNNVNPLLATSFTPVKIRKFLNKLIYMQPVHNLSTPTNKRRVKSSVWLENELRAYQWVLVAMSATKATLIKDFTNMEWSDLQTIFGKEVGILEYEAVKLINQRSMSKRNWGEQELLLLQNIIRQDLQNNKWNETARTLFTLSDKRYFRTGKQCRQRWYNHLDPDKKHGQWQSTEDSKIIEQVISIGRRWSIIAKRLGNKRTQHMVKNRFKTLLLNLKKKHPEIQEENDLLRRFLPEDLKPSPQTMTQRFQDELPGCYVNVERLGRYDYSQLQDDLVIFQDFQDDIPLAFLECQIGQAPSICVGHPLTPNIISTPNSLNFLRNYSFERFEFAQSIFFKNL